MQGLCISQHSAHTFQLSLVTNCHEPVAAGQHGSMERKHELVLP